MSSYYYLVPTLPMLRIGMNEYMSLDQFLAICKGKVSEKDYRILSNATLTGEAVDGNPLLRDFSRFRSMVEHEMVAQRAQRLGLKEERYVNKGDKESAITESVRKAVNADNPLEGEKLILSIYWDYLDRHVSSTHLFDLTFLISYALRLQILSRISSFTEEKGEKEFDRLFGNLKKEIFPLRG